MYVCVYVYVYMGVYICICMYITHKHMHTHHINTEVSTRKRREKFPNYFHSPSLKIEKEKANGIFGFEIHDQIKDDNAHRFFNVYIINNTGKHTTDQ